MNSPGTLGSEKNAYGIFPGVILVSSALLGSSL